MARDVIVLDEDAVAGAHAMVVAAAHAHGVLVEQAHPWDRLARVDELCGKAFDPADELVGGGRDATHALDEVQGGTLGAEDARHTAAYGGNVHPTLNGRAVVDEPGCFEVGVDLPKHLEGDVDAREHAVGLGHHQRLARQIVRQQRGGGVVGDLVFGEGHVNELNRAVPVVEHRVTSCIGLRVRRLYSDETQGL